MEEGKTPGISIETAIPFFKEATTILTTTDFAQVMAMLCKKFVNTCVNGKPVSTLKSNPIKK
jgi:hypothetical protein